MDGSVDIPPNNINKKNTEEMHGEQIVTEMIIAGPVSIQWVYIGRNSA